MADSKNQYAKLSEELIDRIEHDRANHVENPYACKNEACIRRDMSHDKPNLWRPSFVRDAEKIMHIPYYPRYMDKTQVFSLVKNDDVSRRALHVQLVSRIARNIGSVLNLNCDLIEAQALGHDIGHTPFGHAGERKLSQIYHERTGKFFNHNIHSARVLDTIFPLNISLQTLDGIICHNGELECKEYRPSKLDSFTEYDKKFMACYTDESQIKKLCPSTLEGCVVRVSDIIAYIGKDRQDAKKLGIIEDESEFEYITLGSNNAAIINNMIVNIIENSYGKSYISMDEDIYKDFTTAKKENYEKIYLRDDMNNAYENIIFPMFDKLYERLYKDAVSKDENSLFYKHHIQYVEEYNKYKANCMEYRLGDPDDLVVDYIASMTDDYFIDLYKELFPNDNVFVCYKGYFD